MVRIGLAESRAICRFSTALWWAPPETETFTAGGAIHCPIWWVGIETISAIAKRGLLVRGEGWKGDLRFTLYLTERGAEIADKLIAMEKPSDASIVRGREPRPTEETPHTSEGAAGWRGAPLTLEGSAV